ncbi:hypothetical protein [Alsobacter sp. R-9]
MTDSSPAKGRLLTVPASDFDKLRGKKLEASETPGLDLYVTVPDAFDMNATADPPLQGPWRRVVMRWTIDWFAPGWQDGTAPTLRIDRPGRSSNRTGRPRHRPAASRLVIGERLSDAGLAVIAEGLSRDGRSLLDACKFVVVTYCPKVEQTSKRVEQIRQRVIELRRASAGSQDG